MGVSSRSVSPSREESPFALLGLEPAFDLDVTALERTHRELSRALHPDATSAPPRANGAKPSIARSS